MIQIKNFIKKFTVKYEKKESSDVLIVIHHTRRHMRQLLEGIKVLELGTHISVPKAARLMADWGADVIKVEPLGGEGWRTIGRSYGIPFASDCNGIFQAPNANKKSITLNLKEEKGKKIFLDLISQADVFLTNNRLNSLKKLNIDYESICKTNPKLIYAHFSGFGTKGPDKDRPGFDIAAYWAKAGMPIEWTHKESTPFRALPGFGDSTVATVILSGILAALYSREKTGQGEFLQTSLYGSALWFNSCGIVQAQYQQKGSYPKSKYEQPTPYHIIYESKDHDYFLFSIPTWNKVSSLLLKHINLPEYAEDERFVTLENCRNNMKLVIDTLVEAFKKMTTQEIVDMFIELDVVFELLKNPHDVLEDPQAWENEYFNKVILENGSELIIPEPPIKFKNSQRNEFKNAPQLGQDSCSILKSLQYTDEEIKDLIKSGITSTN